MKRLLTLSFLLSFFVASTLDFTNPRYSLKNDAVKGQSHLHIKNATQADAGPYVCFVVYPKWSSCPPLTSPDAQVIVLDNGSLTSKPGRSSDHGRSAAIDFTSRSVSLNQSTYPISFSSPFIFFLHIYLPRR